MTSSVDIAISLANNFGWKVFPANPENKRPLVSGWKEKASSEADQIAKLFEPFGGAMVAIPTGPINGLTVVDVDRKNGVDGLQTLMKLAMRMPTSAIVYTPTGGLHLYYSSQDEEYPCSVGKIGPGVDVRGVGGYVIGAGSVGMTGAYRWKNDLHKTKYGILPLTVDLKQAITGKFRKSNKIDSPCASILDPVMEGQRNDEITRRCGVLFHKGYPAEEVEMMLHRINEKCCTPPLDDREVSRIFQSIAKREGE